MIRRAIFGLMSACLIIVVLLACLGFRPAHLPGFFQTPYEEALAAGEYLDPLAVWVDSPSAAGVHDFQLTVHNPTPQKLRLVAKWDIKMTDCTISPAEVDLACAPGETMQMDMQLSVPERSVEGAEHLVTTLKHPVLTGEWVWQQPVFRQGLDADEVAFPLSATLEVRRAFGRTNYLVLGAYLAGMLAIGFWASRRIKGSAGFFIGEGKLNYVIVGLSLLGTYLSALTMMGLPGKAYGNADWTITVQLPCLILTALVITGVVLPRYRAAGIVSIYAFLEQRIDVSARVAASICFVVFSIGRMGLVLYLPALAFATMTGAPLSACIVGMGVIITVYTVMGGIEAVVWTDAIQVIIFVAGALLTLGYIFSDLGVDQFMNVGVAHNKFRVIVPGFDVTKATTAWLVLETIFSTIRIYGTQQDMAQRYMTTESTDKANRSVWIAILGYIPLGFIFYFIGTSLFAYFQVHHDVNLPPKPDQMYAHFIINYLPEGIAGLLVAAMFAAAMSSIDSCMNSSSTVCIEDFIKRFGRSEVTDQECLRKARLLTLVWGACAVIMGLLFMEVQYAQDVWWKVMGLSTNGVLGLMALAFLPTRINKWAAMAGFAVSYGCLFSLMGLGVHQLLWPVIGNTVCFLVALFLNPLMPRTEA